MDRQFASPEHRLYDAASRWYPELRGDGPQRLIDAAVQCLVDGLDSPSLRILAGASPADRNELLKELLEAALDELDIPRPDPTSPWQQVIAGGRVMSRQPTDRIRFELRPADGSVGGHELLVYVNDVEVTRAGAGMGMGPFDVLIPDNRLVATVEPKRVPIARCECGVYGCGMTDATIVREGGAVHWDWLHEAPMDHGVTFDADEYDAEVARVAADHRWERPEDTTARLVLERVDRAKLAEQGLTVSWVAKDHADPDVLKVALFAGSDGYDSSEPGYQIFLRFPRGDRGPEHVASEVDAALRLSPGRWKATWHAIQRGVDRPPPMASWRWRREHIG